MKIYVKGHISDVSFSGGSFSNLQSPWHFFKLHCTKVLKCQTIMSQFLDDTTIIHKRDHFRERDGKKCHFN